MPPTQRLYYTDSYLTQAQSCVTSASEDGTRITLDQTVFYPASGGQPHDLGALNGIPVLDVIDNGETIVHVLAEPLTAATVEGTISWTRRYDHMQQHTGQHLLSAVLEECFQCPTLSFHLGDEVSTIELGASELTQNQIDTSVLRATELARANPTIAVTFEDAAHAQGLRKASERAGTLRIVEIPGIDRSACGGTHVAALAEVLPLQIRDVDKVRGNIKLSFVCGNRAIAQAQNDFQALGLIARTLATSPGNAASQIAILQQRLAEADKSNQRLETEAATRAGLDLYSQTSPGDDGIRRCLMPVPVIAENARTQAKAFVSRGKAVLLMHSPEGVLLGCSPDSGINAGAVLKQALTKFGARGGGSPALAQGSLSDPLIVPDLAKTLGL
jgi:alanyl-tRNA synthetase